MQQGGGAQPSPAPPRWNQLDLAIVLLSVLGIALEEIEMSAALPINPTIIRIMRVLRIARGRPPARPSRYAEAGGGGELPCCRSSQPRPRVLPPLSLQPLRWGCVAPGSLRDRGGCGSLPPRGRVRPAQAARPILMLGSWP